MSDDAFTRKQEEEDYSVPVTSNKGKGNLPYGRNSREPWFGWNPFPEIEKAFSNVMKLFERFTDEIYSLAVFPQTDIRRQDGTITLTAEVPGLSRNNLDVQVYGDCVRLAGKRCSRNEHGSPDRNGYRMNGYYNAFFRILPLPVRVKSEEARIEYQGDTLIITVPEA